MKKQLTILATCGFVTLSIVGCGAQAKSNSPTSAASAGTGTNQTVNIATINDYPPFEYVKNGQLTGFDIELLQDAAKAEHLNVSWKVMKFDGIIPALQANQVDGAISAITIRPDRAEVVNFATPYFNAGLSLVVKKDSSIQSVSDLKGKTIVAKQGTTGLAEAQKIAQQEGAKVTIVQDDASLYLAVQSGQADAMVEDYPGVAYKIKTDGSNAQVRIIGKRLTVEQYGIAVSKSNTALLNELNAGLKKLQDNGQLKQLNDAYFGS